MRTISLATVCTVMFFFLAIGLINGKEVKRIFIVHSYEQGHLCGQPQHDGAMKSLADAGWILGENLEVGVYYMDTKRKNNTKDLIEEQGKKARQAIDDFKPDVVLTLDDNAFRTVALPLVDTGRSFVFSGMNGQPESYNKQVRFMNYRGRPDGYITGVYEKLYIREAINVLSAMHPMKSILILGDQSPTGKAITSQIHIEIQPKNGVQPLPVEIKQQIIYSWEDFKKVITDINDDPGIGAFYLGTLLLKDADGKTFTTPDMIDYTLEHARKPAIGLNYAFIKRGLYGGATVDFYAMGQLAGKKIAGILSGQKPGDMPIEDAPRVALVFNLTRAEELGMDIPPDILMAADEVFRK